MLSASVGEFGKSNGAEPHHSAVLSKPVEMAHLLDAIQGSLKLEWDYEDVQPVNPSPDLSLEAVLPLNFERTDLPELIRLGRAGHIRAIETKLDELEQRFPDAGPFTARLRGFIRDIDLQGYISDLEALSRHDP
jgi:hypothetical protein